MGHRRRSSPAHTPRPAGYLTIGELVEASGATKATIHHYSTIGLLPTPVKTAHNMAYYHPECVERLELVRAFRDRHVPLATAREIIDAHGISGARSILSRTAQASMMLSGLVAWPGSAASRDQILESSGLAPESLDDLEDLGLLRRDGDVYDSLSAELVGALGRLRRAGLTDEIGFSPGDVVLYRDAMAQVVQHELEYFDSRLLGQSAPDEASALMDPVLMAAVLEHAEALCVLVRRRLLLDAIEAAGNSDFSDEYRPIGRLS